MNRLFSILLIPLVFLFLFAGYFHPLVGLNQDLGRHFLLGQIILETLTVPKVNLFSYTYPDFPFINLHWLPEIIFYLVHTLTGIPGLFILSLVLIGAAFGLMFFKARKNSSLIVLSFISVIYLRILFERTDLRPELFSFLFLSIMVTTLYSYRERFTKLIYLLIPLELIWVNTHIYFFIGLFVLGLFSVDAAITHRKNLLSKVPKTLFLVTCLSALVTLMNPNGVSGAIYPFRVFENYGYTIEENQNPFFLQSLGFNKPSLPYQELATVLLFASLFVSLRKTRVIDWLLSISFTGIAFMAVRNFPLFVFATLIPCSYLVTESLRPLVKRSSPERKQLLQFILLIGFVLLIIWQVKSITQLKGFGYGVEEDGKGALTFVKEQKITGPIFNNFDIGSYIEYQLYPTERVFIDGRPGEYPAAFLQNTYIKMQEDPKVFAKVSEKYRFNTIIFSHTDQTPWAEQFVKAITQNPDFVVVYLDPSMLVLVKNTTENQALIKRFGMKPTDLTMIKPDSERELRAAAHFYAGIGDTKKIQPLLLQLLTYSPHDCATLQALISIYTAEQNLASQIYLARYQTACR